MALRGIEESENQNWVNKLHMESGERERESREIGESRCFSVFRQNRRDTVANGGRRTA